MKVKFTYDLLCNREYVSLIHVRKILFIGHNVFIFLDEFIKPLKYKFSNISNLEISTYSFDD